MSELQDFEAMYAAMPREQKIDAYMDLMHRLSLILDEHKMQVRQKPILGGVFGHGGFVILSHWNFYNGLDEVAYYIAEASTRFVISRAETKAEALEFARLMLTHWLTIPRVLSEAARHKRACADADAERQRKWQEAMAERDAQREQEPGPQRGVVRSIPRRRRQIFEESDGKCHYCGTALTIDGKWHIEHKMPKALGGGNEPGNLVASCVSCNHKKRDTTDIEFKAKLAKERPA